MVNIIYGSIVLSMDFSEVASRNYPREVLCHLKSSCFNGLRANGLQYPAGPSDGPFANEREGLAVRNSGGKISRDYRRLLSRD